MGKKSQVGKGVNSPIIMWTGKWVDFLLSIGIYYLVAVGQDSVKSEHFFGKVSALIMPKTGF